MGDGVFAADAIGNGARTVNALRLTGICLSVVIGLGLASIDRSWAIDASDSLTDANQQAAYEKIINEVRCLVCQNQTIADSSAPLAEDLRREIRAMVEEGNSETDIKVFLVERYGDFVLYRPRGTLLDIGAMAGAVRIPDRRRIDFIPGRATAPGAADRSGRPTGGRVTS